MYTSIIRTLVPLIAGVLITQALRLGVHLDEGAVTNTVQASISGLYYTVFRGAEARLSPAWGWFLGIARPPQYSAAPATQTLSRRGFLGLSRRRQRSKEGTRQ
jgi:hypothetical protein